MLLSLLFVVISFMYSVIQKCGTIFCRYVGRLFVKNGGKPSEILTKLNEMAGFPPNEEIELYEVCFFNEFVFLYSSMFLLV